MLCYVCMDVFYIFILETETEQIEDTTNNELKIYWCDDGGYVQWTNES